MNTHDLTCDVCGLRFDPEIEGITTEDTENHYCDECAETILDQ